jgi:hypothetical protein
VKSIVGDVTLDEALENIGFTDNSSLLKIEVNDDEVDLDCPGWASVGNSGSTLMLLQVNT